MSMIVDRRWVSTNSRNQIETALDVFINIRLTTSCCVVISALDIKDNAKNIGCKWKLICGIRIWLHRLTILRVMTGNNFVCVQNLLN